MLMLGVTLIGGVSTGPRDGAGFESRGPGAENLAPTHPYKKYNNELQHLMKWMVIAFASLSVMYRIRSVVFKALMFISKHYIVIILFIIIIESLLYYIYKFDFEILFYILSCFLLVTIYDHLTFDTTNLHNII